MENIARLESGPHLWDTAHLGSPSLTAVTEEIFSRNEGYGEYEYLGKPRRVIYKKSPLTGWKFILGTVSE